MTKKISGAKRFLTQVGPHIGPRTFHLFNNSTTSAPSGVVRQCLSMGPEPQMTSQLCLEKSCLVVSFERSRCEFGTPLLDQDTF